MSGTAINVLYFAQVAELTGTRLESWPLAEAVSGAQWLEQLEARYPQLAPTQRLKLAVNQFHVKHSVIINPGDEVAVFEPVTGG
ncbi:molybdopterin synthase sulfur carrier subunit [Pusillimonas sp. T2]|uniref:MoaD/ThiS family protein n=1 Tax=Pusillimonas sp. T2 TaxID=1548123 RepID=UPI000B946494|nr:MoaD/ThiS family protein [Pusillimonas sp. T2]OXR50653.1 molybdopterin synthase sulfur carrier subunit [Pusillimonas sp. T2]